MRQQELINGRVMEGRTDGRNKEKKKSPFLSLFLSVFLFFFLGDSAKYFAIITISLQARRVHSRPREQVAALPATPSIIRHRMSLLPLLSFSFFSFSHIPNVTHSLATLGRAARPHSTSLFCRRRHRRRLSAALLLLIAALGRVGPSVM